MWPRQAVPNRVILGCNHTYVLTLPVEGQFHRHFSFAAILLLAEVELPVSPVFRCGCSLEQGLNSSPSSPSSWLIFHLAVQQCQPPPVSSCNQTIVSKSHVARFSYLPKPPVPHNCCLVEDQARAEAHLAGSGSRMGRMRMANWAKGGERRWVTDS